MALNAMKHLLNSKCKSGADICYFVWKRCEYSLLSNNFPSRFHTQSLFQKEETVHDVKPVPIPIVQGNSCKNITCESLNVITSDDIALIKETETDALEPCKEDVSDIGPFVLPSFHLAAYVNSSHTLQQLVKMGVQLYDVEKKEGAAEFILKLDFEKQIKPYLRFLHDIGVSADEFGKLVTRNPFIFMQDLDDLHVRINYLEAKKFPSDGIPRIVTRSPNWLNFSTVEIDKRLGWFQSTFILAGDEVRFLAVKRPQLITTDLARVTVSSFAVKEEMGFDDKETKALLLKAPKLFHINVDALRERFDFVHNIMGISHDHLLQEPDIMLFRTFIVKQRHEFLKALGKAQYDPKLPNYIPLMTLVHGSDVDFCRNVAKTSIETFNAFLKAR